MDTNILRPLFDRVVVRPVEIEKQTTMGIILPGKTAEQPNRGFVISTGPGITLASGELRSLSVSVGDEVIYAASAASNIVSVDNTELLVMNEYDILGIITD